MPPETARAGSGLAPADHGLFGPASVTWRLILPAARAARDQARAFQRALAARCLTAVQ
jgi:hypothetical protein